MKLSFRAIVDSLTVPTFVIDADHKVLAWNKACELLTGVLATDIIGTKEAWRGFYPAERPCLADVIVDNSYQSIDKLYPIYGEAKFSQGLHAESWFSEINGKKRYLIFDAEPLYDDDGSLIGSLENLEDVTHIKQDELKSNTHSKVMSLLLQGVPLTHALKDLIHEIELDDPFAQCNIMLLDSSRKKPFTNITVSLPDFFINAVNEQYIANNDTILSQQNIIIDDIQNTPSWASLKDIAKTANVNTCWSQAIMGSNGKMLGIFSIYHEVSIVASEGDLQFLDFMTQLAAVAIEQSYLRQQQQISSQIYDSTHEGIMITDARGVLLDVNQAFCDITGYSREEAIGRTPKLLNSGKQPAEFYEKLWITLNNTGRWQGELWNKTKNGELFAERLSISALKDEHSEVINYVGIFSDITHEKQQQEKLKQMAHYDELTQLPNRTLFTDRFNQAIARSDRYKTLLAILFLDLDKFKPVNDELGHDVGDKLLIEVAERIKNILRKEDTVSRQGGDEFALLLGDINSIDEVKGMTRRIHQALSEPFKIDGHSITIGASSGVTLYPLDKSDLDTLIRHADEAMYLAKRTGRNRSHLFEDCLESQ